MNDATTDDLRGALDGVRERLNERIDDLTKRLDQTLNQRDDLAACLRGVLEGFNNGRYVCANPLSPGTIREFTMTVTAWQAALARIAVRDRLDDKLRAEARRGEQ